MLTELISYGVGFLLSLAWVTDAEGSPQVKIQYALRSDKSVALTCQVQTGMKHETEDSFFQVYLKCPLISTQICYMNCAPNCYEEEGRCLVPTTISSVISNCQLKRDQALGVLSASYVVDFRHLERSGNWSCEYAGESSALLPLHAVEKQTVTSPPLPALPPVTFLPSLVEENKPTGNATSDPTPNSSEISRRKETSQDNTYESFIGKFDAFLSKGQMLFAIFFLILLSLFLNVVLVIRLCLTKSYIENMRFGKHDTCLSKCLCYESEEKKFGILRNSNILLSGGSITNGVLTPPQMHPPSHIINYNQGIDANLPYFQGGSLATGNGGDSQNGSLLDGTMTGNSIYGLTLTRQPTLTAREAQSVRSETNGMIHCPDNNSNARLISAPSSPVHFAQPQQQLTSGANGTTAPVVMRPSLAAFYSATSTSEHSSATPTTLRYLIHQNGKAVLSEERNPASNKSTLSSQLSRASNGHAVGAGSAFHGIVKPNGVWRNTDAYPDTTTITTTNGHAITTHPQLLQNGTNGDSERMSVDSCLLSSSHAGSERNGGKYEDCPTTTTTNPTTNGISSKLIQQDLDSVSVSN